MKDVLVFDIETETFGKPNPHKDKLKFIGFQFPSGTKLMYNYLQKEAIQSIFRRFRNISGHNIKYYDVPILERFGIEFKTFTNKRHIMLDTYEILSKRAKSLMRLNLGKGEMSLRQLCKRFGLSSKGDMDYNILKKNSWNKEELALIKEYLYGDLQSSTELLDYLENYFHGFKHFLSRKDVKELKWLTSSSGSFAYKAICHRTGLPEIYDDRAKRQKFRAAISWVRNDIKSAENVVAVDFKSLYPHMMIGGNLYTPAKEGEDFWNGMGVYLPYLEDREHGIRGKYSRKRGKVEEFLKELFDSRNEDKKEMKKLDKNSDRYRFLDKIQYAKKIILNTSYGIAGNPTFKSVYDVIRANDITAMARRSLVHATDVYESYGYELIYRHSVDGDSKTWYKVENKINEFTFNEFWNLFKNNNIIRKNGNEYIYLKDVETLTMDKDLNIVWKPLKYIMRHLNDVDCYKININNQNSLIVTSDHSVMNIENYTHKLTEVKPETLSKVILNSGFGKKQQVEINHQFEFFGYWIGNGWFRKDNYIGISTGNDKEELLEKCLNYVTELKNNNIYHSHKGNISLCNTKFVRYMKSLGFISGSKKKRIPEMVYESSFDDRCSFLRGMFSSDGTVVKGVPRYTTVNEKLAYDLKKLLMSVGIGSSVIKENKTNKYNNKDSGTYSYHIRILAMKIDIYKKNIGFIFKRKTDKIKDSSNISYSFKRISTEKANYDGYVYDVEVEDTHNFFANDVLVHNTDSCYIIDKYNDKDKVLAIAKEISEIQRKSFNIDIETHELEFDGEYIKFWLIQNDDGENLKNRNIGLKPDGTFSYTGIKLASVNTSEASKEVFNKHISKYLKENLPDELYIPVPKLMSWMKDVIKDDHTLLEKRYKVYDISQYKSKTSLQAQISKRYGDGIHNLILNKYIGAGKSKKYAKISELKKSFGDKWMDVIDYKSYLKELIEFIKPKMRKTIK
ncbi:MAG: LAGLIDADG family homing endonuclease [Thermotogota bacterium]